MSRNHFFFSLWMLLHDWVLCVDLHFWAWSKSRARCPSYPPRTPMFLQGGSLVRPIAHKQSRITCIYWGFAQTRAMDGPSKHQGGPPVDYSYLTLPTGASGDVISWGGETGHFRGYQPARNHKEIWLLEGPEREKREKKKPDTSSCFHK